MPPPKTHFRFLFHTPTNIYIKKKVPFFNAYKVKKNTLFIQQSSSFCIYVTAPNDLANHSFWQWTNIYLKKKIPFLNAYKVKKKYPIYTAEQQFLYLCYCAKWIGTHSFWQWHQAVGWCGLSSTSSPVSALLPESVTGGPLGCPCTSHPGAARTCTRSTPCTSKGKCSCESQFVKNSFLLNLKGNCHSIILNTTISKIS